MSETNNEVPATTPNFATEAAGKLAELFPEIVADGKINLDALKPLLDADVEDVRERFGLTWPGKRDAIRAAQMPTTATLMPDKENSVDWETTQTVFIEGNSLEALKVLQKHYYGQAKMIYIELKTSDLIRSAVAAQPLLIRGFCFWGGLSRSTRSVRELP
ncbi:hypothetical protein [Corynebacterium urealyticum]|uniref:hypothetical protein n=1 Tax=Corynebacterium urealyticum TaxID=43771 RepID=UPI00293F0856|nr:hypothetical protein [Corynebacterium urealyticum]WOH93762.1 hypothetical protein RZ943_06535 [Corynebacterium urealyticum]